VKVLVDTPVWSLAFRRQPSTIGAPDQAIVSECAELVRDGRAAIIGPIRQETLSGIREPSDFEKVRSKLAAIPDTPLTTPDFEEAAKFSNYCRSRGVAATSVDLMLWAITIRLDASLFTTDGDFVRFAKLSKLRLHQTQNRSEARGNGRK
jgi:predicted nucleic acid-binding protein